jgi:hypothetical protein
MNLHVADMAAYKKQYIRFFDGCDNVTRHAIAYLYFFVWRSHRWLY